MRDIEYLETARRGPMTYASKGCVYTLMSPDELPWNHLMSALEDGIPPHLGPAPRISLWRLRALFGLWVAHHDLPSFDDARRLCYLVDTYRRPLEVDLWTRMQVDLNELWHERRWRRLLNMIDHLPRDTFYSEAVSADPEHTRMLAKAIAERAASGEATEPSGPALHTWSPEMAMQADLIDAVRNLQHTLAQVNSQKKIPEPKPYPRPVSKLAEETKRAELARRKASHDSLVARLLPHKASVTH